MIYPRNFEHTIGFSTVRAEIAAHCISDMGKMCCEQMSFMTDYDLIHTRLTEVNEFLSLVTRGVDFPLNYYFDLRQELKVVEAPGTYATAPTLFRSVSLSFAIL